MHQFWLTGGSKHGKCSTMLTAGVECVLIPFCGKQIFIFYNFLACESCYLNPGIGDWGCCIHQKAVSSCIKDSQGKIHKWESKGQGFRMAGTANIGENSLNKDTAVYFDAPWWLSKRWTLHSQKVGKGAQFCSCNTFRTYCWISWWYRQSSRTYK